MIKMQVVRPIEDVEGKERGRICQLCQVLNSIGQTFSEDISIMRTIFKSEWVSKLWSITWPWHLPQLLHSFQHWGFQDGQGLVEELLFLVQSSVASSDGQKSFHCDFDLSKYSFVHLFTLFAAFTQFWRNSYVHLLAREREGKLKLWHFSQPDYKVLFWTLLVDQLYQLDQLY